MPPPAPAGRRRTTFDRPTAAGRSGGCGPYAPRPRWLDLRAGGCDHRPRPDLTTRTRVRRPPAAAPVRAVSARVDASAGRGVSPPARRGPLFALEARGRRPFRPGRRWPASCITWSGAAAGRRVSCAWRCPTADRLRPSGRWRRHRAPAAAGRHVLAELDGRYWTEVAVVHRPSVRAVRRRRHGRFADYVTEAPTPSPERRPARGCRGTPRPSDHGAPATDISLRHTRFGPVSSQVSRIRTGGSPVDSKTSRSPSIAPRITSAWP